MSVSWHLAEGGRKRTLNDYLADLTAEHHPLGRLSAVGRLDKETTGLLLLTDDGHLSERVLRPGGLLKVYEATVKLRSPATCDAERLQRMCQGVELADGMARADSAEVVRIRVSSGENAMPVTASVC